MSTRFGSKVTGAALAVVAALAFIVPAAQATPITFYNNAATQTSQRFTVGCGSAGGDCTGLLAAVSNATPLAWSSTVGQMLGGPSDASPASEMAFVNSMLATSFDENSGNIAPSAGKSFAFSLSADYLLIKVGAGPRHQAYGLLQNLGGDLDLWFTSTGQAGGLSHYITFGSAATDVPEPAALGMFGLGLSLLGGFMVVRRRYT
ncbi:hypothetical protein ASD68_05450 [Rhodanobacter sp. Root627]|nr:hypothetical protein ASD68_05450 [Rhodanobacter sp. Root627]